MEHERNELDETRAAAHLPSREMESEPSTQGHATESSGVAGQHPLPPAAPSPNGAFAPSPLIEPYSDAAPFWHQPLEPGVFQETPLIVHQRMADAECTVLMVDSYLRNAGYEIEANELRMRYTHWVKIPAMQYELLRRELEPQCVEYQQQIHETNAAIEQAKIEFNKAMAKAKIPLPQPPKPKKRQKQPPLPEPIYPHLVERALQEDFAHDEDVCGEQGVAPVSTRNDLWATIGQWFFENFAPLAAGLILGINLGVITGLLSLEVIQRGEMMWLVALAALIGLFIEKLVGNTAYSLTASAAMASEKRGDIEGAEPFPSTYSKVRIVLFSVLLIVIAGAVALVDALGLHMLYEERQQEARLLGGGSETQVPFWVFLIVGTIISVPYIVYKAVKGWREPEIRQRQARITYLRWKHIERRREEPAVQEAFVKAQAVENLYQRRDTLQKALERLEQRLDSARTECVGSTQKFCDYWNELTNWLRQERAATSPAWGYTPRRQGTNETLLQKLLGWFRRG